MNILIAIVSCRTDQKLHRNLRDSWLKDVPSDVTAKFFVGTPALVSPSDDEVSLPVPDTFAGVSQKVCGIIQWAYDHGFDYIFKCDTDTFVYVPRLLASGFENYDYSGKRYPPSNIFEIHAPGVRNDPDWGDRLGNRSEAYGGSGYWLSRKAMKIILDNKSSTEYRGSSEDWWVGAILRRYDITTHNDPRYQDFIRTSPAPWNDLITCHRNRAGYNSLTMWESSSTMRQYETMQQMYRRATVGSTSKVLIAIHGYVNGAKNGEHQSMRDTSLQGIERFPNVEYKFFIGDGTPTGADESQLWTSFRGHEEEYKKKAKATLGQIFDYTPKDDEVVVHVPDGYVHLPYKTRESCKWALEHGFEYIFECFPDTYINLDRLLGSRFEKHDYTGHQCGGYAAGGPGYWISRKVAQIIADEPIVTDWAEDRWVGRVMTEHTIPFVPDQRYAEAPLAPRVGNDIITSHMGHTPHVFTPEMAKQVHAAALVTQSIIHPPRRLRYAKDGLTLDWFDMHPKG